MQRSLLRFLIASTLAGISATTPAQAEVPAATARRIDAVFSSLDGKPGCSVGVYHRGEVVFAKGYGLANLEHQVPNTRQTVFDIASTSKQFTAMAVILLAQEGKLSLDDDVRKHLPRVPDYGTPITIRQLMSHTSGLRDFIYLFLLQGRTLKDYYTDEEIYDMLARQSATAFPPGSAYSYSNSGYFLLARVVEKVAGKSLAQFAHDRIFAPLRMTNTHMHADSSAVVRRRAYGYYGNADGTYRVGGSFLEFTGDGGVYTTVEDLQRWDEDYYRGKVWRPEVKKEMLRVSTLTSGEPVRISENGFYAGGLGIAKWRGLPVERHAGSWVGYVSDYVRFPEQHFSVAVLCNTDAVSPMELTGKVADVFLEQQYTEPPKKRVEADSGKQPETRPIPAAILKELPGTYYSADLDTRYTITYDQGALKFEIGARRTILDLSEYGSAPSLMSEDTIGNEGASMKLQRGADGQIEAFLLDAGRTGNIRFERVR